MIGNPQKSLALNMRCIYQLLFFSGLPSELDKLLVGNPEVNKIVQLIQNSPAAVSTFVYNALIQTSKVRD